MSIFGPKNALFGYFWDKIIKSYCHIWNQYPQICQNLNFSICNFQSMKSPVELNSFFLKFFCYITWFDETGDWRACKRGFYVEFYCFFETIGYWFEKLQNALTHTPNFGIRSVFFKGPGSIFLKVQIRVQVRFIMYAFLKAGSYIFISTWNSAF